MQVDKIRLNMLQIYSELGLKTFREFSRENVYKGKQSATNYAGKVSSTRNRMAAIQSNEDVIPQLAKEETRTKELGVKMDIAPKTLVKMQIVKGASIDVRV